MEATSKTLRSCSFIQFLNCFGVILIVVTNLLLTVKSDVTILLPGLAMPNLSKVFANRVSALIEQMTLTKVEVSRKIGISRPTLDRYLEGQALDLDAADKLAQAVGAELKDVLFHGEGPEPIVIRPSPEQNARDALALLADRNIQRALTVLATLSEASRAQVVDLLAAAAALDDPKRRALLKAAHTLGSDEELQNPLDDLADSARPHRKKK